MPRGSVVAGVSMTRGKWLVMSVYASYTLAGLSVGCNFSKKNDTDIPGAGDGGVSTIQNGLAAWTNDCASNVNLVYGGTTTAPSTNLDSVQVVEFNDPQGRTSV